MATMRYTIRGDFASGCAIVMAHRNWQHLPGPTHRERAFSNERRGQREHGAVAHHQLRVAREGHWGLLKAVLRQL
jgi:hypothetical protein